MAAVAGDIDLEHLAKVNFSQNDQNYLNASLRFWSLSVLCEG